MSDQSAEWKRIEPSVNSEAEFSEIAGDFGNPLEIVREALSNSFDARATELRILFDVQQIDGASTLVIEFEDNGSGMSADVLETSFWGLGYSTSKADKDKIGEKGHGTKIFLRSDTIIVKSQTEEGAFESVCEKPWKMLGNGRLHEPQMREIPKWRETPGTLIRVVRYNHNEMSQFTKDIVRDYLYWFTKFGSVEKLVGKDTSRGFKVSLKCLDSKEPEICEFGHKFPDENANGNQLFSKHGPDGADFFVKRYIEADQYLDEMPYVRYDIIVSVEGDKVKRLNNPLIKERGRKSKGTYKVGDRYGIWLCKDYIPVQRVNEWVVGFGTGSNSYTLLHGFINCQELKLTANRGSIGNTDPKILEQLRAAFQLKLEEIDDDLKKNGILELFRWQSEERTLSQEKGDFDRRRKSFHSRKTAILEGTTLREPENESELFGLFTTVYALKPELFDFEPVDYNTTRGIDMLCRNKTDNNITETEFSYIELKKTLSDKLNHGFKYLKYILCWDFSPSITKETPFYALTDIESKSEQDARFLTSAVTPKGRTIYFLSSKFSARGIHVISLKDLLAEECGIVFQRPTG